MLQEEMENLPRIVIISNAHKADDVRLYHKIGKSLSKIACVYILGARGVGSLTDNLSDERSVPIDESPNKPICLIASGTHPIPRLYSLYHQARKLKPDIVICVEPLTMLVGLRLKKKTGCRLVYDAHEYYAAAHGEKYPFPLNSIISGLYFLVEKDLQSRMDLTLAVNEDIFKLYGLSGNGDQGSGIRDQGSETLIPDTASWLPHNGSRIPDNGSQIPDHGYRITHPGIILPNYPTREIWKTELEDCGINNLLPDTQFDTIYLGGLSEERGIMKLLQVVQILHIKYPQFKALFVGKFISEGFKNKFFTFVMDNNLNSHVFCRDAVPPDKVCAIMKQVKIGLSVLHPRYKRYKKALPLKVLEYLTAGIPVVANDFPQLQEIIEVHKLGYCISFHKKEIADAIARLLDLSDEDRKAQKEQCRKVVQENYMWDVVEPRLLSAIRTFF